MTLTRLQRAVLRFGAVMCLIGAVITGVLAVTIDTSSPKADALTVVEDPADIALPSPGLFGARVIVYGSADVAGSTRPAELGCRLLDESGNEMNSAKMSELAVLGSPPVQSQGSQMEPLFTVGSYPNGSRVSCTDASAVSPLAVSAGSTFGVSGGMVRGFAAGLTLLLLLVGVVGVLVLRPRRS